MATRPVRPTTQIQTVVGLDPAVTAALRSHLAEIADSAVLSIVEEVPSYAGAWSGRMGEVIRNAVQLALGGFLTLATRLDAEAPPKAPAIEGAYQLGRGEARQGRTVEALLAAYRIGARSSWHHMSDVAVEAGVAAGQLARFAELVFAYIDELSAASVAGHTDELESSGRVRQRNLDRLARALLTGAPADAVNAAAERAGWEPPGALTAVVLPESQVSHALTALDQATLQPDDVPGLPEGHASLLVPSTASTAARPTLLSALRGTDAVVGPSTPWLEVGASHRRAVRCAALGLSGLVDTDDHLAALVLGADADARADLRARVLAPLADLRPSTAEKLTDTLRSWLLNHGRRDAVAEELFVHAQTVRYRVQQLREVYGDRLEDPAFVLDATLALA